MAVSVSNTVYGIIKDAMVDAGLLQEGEDPNSEQLASHMRRLCDIINLWQTQGLKLFLHQEITIPLVLAQSSYTVNSAVGVLPNRHLRVLSARVDTPAGLRRILTPVSWNEWFRLPQSANGAVSSYFIDKQTTSLNIKLWPAPDANDDLNSVVVLVHTQAPNPYNLESNVAFPQEWRIALRWGLADDIATGQPQAIMDRCQQRAMLYREMLENWDVEDTEVTFAPAQGGFNGSFH